jgi:pimeloyl-ACP methyl ester carboxylesterase
MHTHTIQTDGLRHQVLEAGDGPLVLLIHGFPELGISWRAQVAALAEAGYRAVAPDMRGYGGTDRPERTEDHTILHLVGDMVDLVRALGHQTCVVVGHDWGAPVAWHCALMRPDLFMAVAGLSVPFQPRRAGGPPTPAMAALARRAGKGELYINQFQAPDAHRIFEADVATGLRKGFYSYDGATPDDRQSTGFIAPGHNFISEVADDAALPPWMSPEHFAVLKADFLAHLEDREELYVADLFGGSQPEYRVNVRVITQMAWHNLFIKTLLVRPTAEEVASFVPEYTIINLPSFKADPERHGCRSDTVIAVSFTEKLILIGNTEYSGEMKKGVFGLLNYLLPAQGVMPMHC